MLEMQPRYLASMMEEVSRLQKIGWEDTERDNDSMSLNVSLKSPQDRRCPREVLAFQFKLCFLGRQWNICVHRSHVGWNCGFRTWNLVSIASPVSQCINRDDVNALRQLFETGAASPFDLLCNENPIYPPRTLLIVSITSRKEY